LAQVVAAAVEKALVLYFTINAEQLVAQVLEGIDTLFLILPQADWQFHVHLVLIPLL
jgi:hypothetical protein